MKARQERVLLLDANVLIALADSSHVHHEPAVRWFASGSPLFATCPFTQGTLLRMLLRSGSVPDIAVAAQVLKGFTSHRNHRFWPADLQFDSVGWSGVLGHRQITDAYLAALARHHGGMLASLDRGLVALHADIAMAVPV